MRDSVCEQWMMFFRGRVFNPCIFDGKHGLETRATLMLFNLSYDLTFEDFAEAMRYSPLRVKGGGGGNGLYWTAVVVLTAVWLALTIFFGAPDPRSIPAAAPMARSPMPAVEAFYVLWMVIALIVIWVSPMLIRSVRVIWQQRVMILIGVFALMITVVLGALAGSYSAQAGQPPPGFWGIQHRYMFFTVMMIILLSITIARYSPNRYRGLWNLNYAVNEPQTLRVLEEAIENETPFRFYRIQYIAIRQLFEAPNVFVLFSGDHLTIIPKRALGSMAETKRFRETMEAKLSGRTFAFPVQAVESTGVPSKENI